jgi:hypothetical protein
MRRALQSAHRFVADEQMARFMCELGGAARAITEHDDLRESVGSWGMTKPKSDPTRLARRLTKGSSPCFP